MSIVLPSVVAVGISWDAAQGAADSSSRPVDLDLACLALDGTGLIIDACFYNNLSALDGAMVHSGDSKDGYSEGVDESITVNVPMLPAYTYALVFVAMCSRDGDFGPCESAHLHCFAGDGDHAALMPAVALGQAAANRSTVVVLGVARHDAANNFVFTPSVSGFPAPARSFMDVYSNGILPLVNIDPIMAEELKGRQKVFHLTKGGSVTLPVGLGHVMFGLGWDSRCDVDASCVGINHDGTEAFKVYFCNKNFEGVVVHGGDNLTGEGDGDDEQIMVRLDALHPRITSVFFTVNVYSGGNFTNVAGEYCRLVDMGHGGVEIARFDCLDCGAFNGLVMVGLYRNLNFPQQWRFEACAHPAMGNTVHNLMDSCRQLHAEHHGAAAPPEPYSAAVTAWVGPPPAISTRTQSDSCCTVQ